MIKAVVRVIYLHLQQERQRLFSIESSQLQQSFIA